MYLYTRTFYTKLETVKQLILQTTALILFRYKLFSYPYQYSLTLFLSGTSLSLIIQLKQMNCILEMLQLGPILLFYTTNETLFN